MALKNWSTVFNAGHGFCTYCDADLLASISTFWSAQRDHVHPSAAGGPDERLNMVIACPSCNQALARSKNLRTVAERRAYIQKLYQERLPTFEQWRKDLRGGI